jgi:Spy/CpxP family protein refolding chaperone
MMMKNGMKAIAAILGAVLVSGSLAACKHHGSHGDHFEKVKEHIDTSLKKVGATDEQRTKIGGITDQIVTDGQQLRKSNQGLKARFVGCLLLDTPNREWLHTTVDEKAKEFTSFAHRTVDRLIEISAVLTPEQRSELKKGFESSHGAKK